MRLFFSGVASASEATMLTEAGVTDWLADPTDFGNLPDSPSHVRVLDSVDDYVARVARLEGEAQIAWAIAPDVIGDSIATRKNWRRVEDLFLAFEHEGKKRPDIYPVYQWGSPWRDLDWYARKSTKVCIGGLVPLMRVKDKGALTELLSISKDHPDLHFLGLNWLKAIEDLADTEHSCDTSKWLDAARYGHVIFKNTRTGHLSQAPAKVLKLNLSRQERCVESARAMREYLIAA
ncbi:hypothetical protein HW932_18705 [Allochromatium humboldtianum]|uniref:Uncharacterized protein n=1 Tax=Allochromatium humboldtianum TaxID=504901 RepID=A0A850RE99_9GAMM|nr:hypothetical protein [Allochromatium humboldtianum]NVZ11285.1 hypothetical protein [Allochromatium humboldtianum]